MSSPLVFERTTGNKLVIDYGVAAQLKDRFLGGEAADVLILTRQLMDDLQKQGKMTTGSLMNVGGTAVAVALARRSPTSVRLKRSSAPFFPSSLSSMRTLRRAAPAASISPASSTGSGSPNN